MVKLEGLDALLHANAVVNLAQPEALVWVIRDHRHHVDGLAHVEVALGVRGQVVSFPLGCVHELDTLARVEDEIGLVALFLRKFADVEEVDG